MSAQEPEALVVDRRRAEPTDETVDDLRFDPLRHAPHQKAVREGLAIVSPSFIPRRRIAAMCRQPVEIMIEQFCFICTPVLDVERGGHVVCNVDRPMASCQNLPVDQADLSGSGLINVAAVRIAVDEHFRQILFTLGERGDPGEDQRPAA